MFEDITVIRVRHNLTTSHACCKSADKALLMLP